MARKIFTFLITEKSAVIRVFNPYAKNISIITEGLSIEIPMEKIHNDGLFESIVSDKDSKYKIEKQY